MAVTPAQFRAAFPAFSDVARYTNEQIQMWLTEAYNSLNTCRWPPASLDLYAQLKAAHWLSIEGAATVAGLRGGVPGQGGGVLSNKSAGPVSAGYDVASGVDQGGDYWNQTTYGQRYWRRARLVGAGGMQL